MCNNASNNDMLLSALESLCPELASGVHTHIRCICHILNLMVKVSLEIYSFHSILKSSQAILSQFTVKRRKAASQDPDEGMVTDSAFDSILDTDEDDEDENELDEEELEAQAKVDQDHEASDDAEIQDLAKEVERDIHFIVGAANAALGRSALLKVWLCFKRLCYVGLHVNLWFSRSQNSRNVSSIIRFSGMTLQHGALAPSWNQS